MFRKISINDKEWIKAKLKEDDDRFCERSFSTIFMYRNLYQSEIAEILGCCVLRCKFETMKEVVPYWTYSYPIGGGDKRGAIEKMLALCEAENIPLHMDPISEENRQELLDWFPGRFFMYANRDHFDYLYSREKLAFLKGKKMQKKRNHIARFKDDEDWSYEALGEENLQECLAMAKKWISLRSDKWNKDMENEFAVMEEAFYNFSQLGLLGGVLRQHGEIIAFTIGEPLNSDTFLVHFEKAMPDIQGAYPMINQQFVQAATEGYTYINREDDMGDLGLRKAKLSYYPEILLRKYMAESSEVVFADLARDREDIYNLWQEAFGDDRAYIDFYLENQYREDNMLVIHRDGKIVSMASFLPAGIKLDGEEREVLYVYAVATLPEYRGQGLAKKILAFAKAYWQKILLLSPAESWLEGFYAKQGFSLAYESQKIALEMMDLKQENCCHESAFKLAGLEEYDYLRNNRWQEEGDIIWAKDMLAHAMEHSRKCSGQVISVQCPVISPQEEIIMYTRDGDKVRIVETTLEIEDLQKITPSLRQYLQKAHNLVDKNIKIEYQRPAGMLWLPEALKDKEIPRIGYFNLALD